MTYQYLYEDEKGYFETLSEQLKLAKEKDEEQSKELYGE